MTILTTAAHNLLYRIGKGTLVIRSKSEAVFHYEDGTQIDPALTDELIESGKAHTEKRGFAEERLVESLWS